MLPENENGLTQVPSNESLGPSSNGRLPCVRMSLVIQAQILLGERKRRGSAIEDRNLEHRSGILGIQSDFFLLKFIRQPPSKTNPVHKTNPQTDEIKVSSAS